MQVGCITVAGIYALATTAVARNIAIYGIRQECGSIYRCENRLFLARRAHGRDTLANSVIHLDGSHLVLEQRIECVP